MQKNKKDFKQGVINVATPDISIIMSVYNGEDYVEQTVKSIIAQTFKNWELIVINDCSTDSTAEILKKYSQSDDRIKVYTNEVNLRLPSSLNKAISLSSGKYIARMDADDICLAARFEKQFEFMEKNSSVDLSSCRFLTVKNGVYSSGGCGGRCDDAALKAMLLTTNPILHPGVIAKAEVMKKLLYNPQCTCTEDLDLWTRFALGNYKIQIQPEYLLIYRLHDKQITATTLEKQHKEVLAIQNNYFEQLVDKMDEQTKEFYINGVYFKEIPDVKKFCNLFKWVKKINKQKKSFDKNSFDYAFFEVLAEYRRHGISKKDVIKAIMCFSPLFLIKEVLRRKKTASQDGKKCLLAARKYGLEQVGGTNVFPIFQQSDK